jgi:Immunomodulating metalloprotease N-terminal domain
MAAFGTSPHGTRFAALPWYDAFSTDGFTPMLQRLTAWLISGNGATAPSSTGTIAVLNTGSSTISSGLVSIGFATAGSVSVCTVSNVDACFVGAKLIVVGSDMGGDLSAGAVSTAVDAALTAGIPVLYVEDHWYYTNMTQSDLGELMGFSSERMQFFTGASAVYADAAAIAAHKVSMQTNIYGSS